VIGSMARIKTMKGYGWVLIWSVDQHADGWAASSLIQRSERNRAQGGAWSTAWGSSKRSKVSSYVI
jgi:hypothetical protein